MELSVPAQAHVPARADARRRVGRRKGNSTISLISIDRARGPEQDQEAVRPAISCRTGRQLLELDPLLEAGPELALRALGRQALVTGRHNYLRQAGPVSDHLDNQVKGRQDNDHLGRGRRGNDRQDNDRRGSDRRWWGIGLDSDRRGPARPDTGRPDRGRQAIGHRATVRLVRDIYPHTAAAIGDVIRIAGAGTIALETGGLGRPRVP